MKKFSDNLAALENTAHLRYIKLFNDDNNLAGIIENKPSSQGSVKLCHHLFKKWGGITIDAAKEGLKLYSEHVEDAENNPGKHPNIDRLFGVIEDKKTAIGKNLQLVRPFGYWRVIDHLYDSTCRIFAVKTSRPISMGSW